AVSIAIVAAAQLIGFVVCGVYRATPVLEKIRRLALGTLAGTAGAALVIVMTLGFEHSSRSVLAIDLFLLWVLAIGWRALRAFWTLERTPQAAAGGDRLVDRAVERESVVPTLVALLSYRELIRNLVFKDLKLKYRGSVLGFLWSMVNPLALVTVYTLAFKYI